MRRTHNFLLIQNKLHWQTYRLLRGRTVSGKLPKIPIFGTFSSVMASWSQQHPQSGVLLTSFLTWGTENSLTEINLESTGVIKGCKLFLGKRLAKTCSSSVKACWTKHAHKFLFPKSSFRIRRTRDLGTFKDSAIILDAIRRSFLTKSATAAMFTSVRVDFGKPHLLSSSTRYLPSRNRAYHLKTFDRFRASFS
jgi:hypothetical protein